MVVPLRWLNTLKSYYSIVEVVHYFILIFEYFSTLLIFKLEMETWSNILKEIRVSKQRHFQRLVKAGQSKVFTLDTEFMFPTSL